MLDIKFIRDNKDAVKKNIENRRMKVDIDLLLDLDEERRNYIAEIEGLRALKKVSKTGPPTELELKQIREVKERLEVLEKRYAPVNEQYRELLMQVPNMAHPDSPIGGEEDFVVLHTSGSVPSFEFAAKDHQALLEDAGMLDFERGAKVAGSKFYFSKGMLVKLNLALIQYGIEILEKHGFELVETPDMARLDVLEGIGFNPRGEESQIYTLEGTELGLIGTAEITMGGYHRDEILDLSQGPKKYAALSHCFRKEAGAYGRTSKGLYRVHQFTKLEMFIYCRPEESEQMHEQLLEIEKEICDGLEIPYRVIDIPTGDLGAPAYRKFDIEGFMTMKAAETRGGDYGEITSTSNCTDYQARRLNIKYKDEQGNLQHVHTLNGTAVVLSRFPIVIVENNQKPDGTFEVPEVLKKYM
ncbi:serine--tRNA ligase [Candidatus Nomurabacteria bacterium]|nr:serine--tRNA ligase [Candidatus Nomurabacteria bacterium]